MIKTLDLTPELRAAIDSVRRAEQFYRPGFDSASLVEIPKLGLADAVLHEVAVQTELARLDRIARLPKARPVSVQSSVRKTRRRA